MKKFMASIFFAVVLPAFLAGGCAPAPQPVQPTSMPAPLATAAQSNPNPANTPSTAISGPVLGLSEPPTGFNWQGVPGVAPAFLVPNGWYFTRELGSGMNNYYVTREKTAAGNSWVFSTGLTISVTGFPKDSNVDLVGNIMDTYTKQKSTKKVVSSSQNTQGNLVTYELLIEAEYANTPSDSPDHNKTVF